MMGKANAIAWRGILQAQSDSFRCVMEARGICIRKSLNSPRDHVEWNGGWRRGPIGGVESNLFLSTQSYTDAHPADPTSAQPFFCLCSQIPRYQPDLECSNAGMRQPALEMPEKVQRRSCCWGCCCCTGKPMLVGREARMIYVVYLEC